MLTIPSVRSVSVKSAAWCKAPEGKGDDMSVEMSVELRARRLSRRILQTAQYHQGTQRWIRSVSALVLMLPGAFNAWASAPFAGADDFVKQNCSACHSTTAP